MQGRAFLERGVQVLTDEPSTGRRSAGADPIPFDQNDVNSRCRKGRRAGTSRQAAADDDDPCTKVAAVPWILGPPGTGEGVEEIRDEPHAPAEF
jgi:hypothetical protein